MKKTLLAASFASLVAGTAFAAPQTYVIDSTHTFPRFSYEHMGLSKQILRFNKTTGEVVFDKDAQTGRVEVTIDMKSIDTGVEAFDGHIQGADFLDTGTYPTATFKSSSVKFEGGKPVSIDGELTIKGVTKPLTLTITSFVNKPHPMLKKDAIGANATAVIKRSEFNAGKFVPAVGDEVTLDIALEAVLK
ncbi:YceI family protein [Parapusillimonas granuli]|uniref:Polyisoprenoid-binding protein n=1 Tax=Parapusillimonas granuli TaxID=380911 RepID=A0A853G4D7_9BURK|nr:YceI family protein [Parapusillimonas granuli]MBB5215767.1 polyisoprenoid-binding protein YceI [Parapusillimonas granuli]MEB2399542.1 YceI family protein [Alcaligenaceae bacterium]NYT51169.1 polyisoprenoid-binding protein [Parapusillimonas granuli]